MPLTLLDFVQQVENVTVDDIPDSTQDSINDELNQQTTQGGGGTDISNPSDARIVAEVAGDNSGESNLNGRAGFTSIQEAIDGENGKNGAPVEGEGIEDDGTIFVEPGTYNESVILSTSGVTIQSTQGSGETIINGDGVNSGSQPHAAIHVDDGSGPVQNVTIDGFTVKNPNGKFGIFAGTGTTNSSPDGIGGLVVQNNTVQDISTTSSGGSLTGGPAGIGIRGDYGTNGNPGIELSNNTVENVQSSGFTNAVGISLKSFTGDAGFGFDSSGSSVSDSSSPPATDTDINNNQILSIDGGDDSRTKGISVSGEFKDVVVDGNNISGISAADDGSAGDALAITLTENGGSYPGNEYDIDGDGNGERIGPRDFEIKNNTIDNLSAASESAVFVGGYEDLDGDGSHAVTGNTINDGTVARFAGNQAGFQPGDEDALNATGNTFTDADTEIYYSDSSSGSDLVAVSENNTFEPDIIVSTDGEIASTGVRFNNQSFSGSTDQVTVERATAADTTDFVLVAHKSSPGEDGVVEGPSEIGRKIGSSDALTGTPSSVTVDLTKTLDEDITKITQTQTLITMLHVADDSGGTNFGSPITRNGTPVFDQAEVTINK